MINSPIEEIKNRLDVIEVLGSYIKLQKAGANFRAVCPFHSEKKPSFFVSPVRQIWHCFGCHKGGDFFKFIMFIENVEFGDALRILANKAGVELKRERPEVKTQRQRLYEICELATRFFEKQLEASVTGKEVNKYLITRGVTQDSIKDWRLGYSPDTWNGLSDFLVSKGYKRDEVESVGLAIKKDAGGYYDRFRGRIIFPVFDSNAQVVGFGGRVFGEGNEKEVAKYMNTPNTLLYDKSRILYGLNKTKMEIRKNDSCILVEGYMDTIMLFQAGFQNVVASSGTALTPYQLKIIKRYSENLFTAFDMDIAGDSATKRSIDLAQFQGFNIKVITMTPGLDPADMVQKDAKEFEKSLKDAKSILDFYFENAFSKTDSSLPEGKKEISKVLLPVIKKIPNKIEQSFWLQELSKKLGVKEESIIEELKKTKTEEDIYGLEPDEIETIPQKTRKEMLEEKLVILILKSPQNINLIEETDFFSDKTKNILDKLKNQDKKEENKEEENLEIQEYSSETQEYLNYLSLKAEVEEIEEKDIIPEIQLCKKELKFIEIRQKLDEISQSLKEIEASGDFKGIQDLTKEFDKYSKLLYDLSKI